MYQGVTSSMPNCCTVGEVGSAQNVATRSESREYAFTSATFCGSVITVFRKVTPALKIFTPKRSMMLAKRPALGNTGAPSVITVVTLAMLFTAGASLFHLGLLGAAVVPPAVLLVWHSPYRLERVTAFLDPWRDPLGNGFQLVQSFLAFGSGGVLGAGLGNGKQKLFYLPEGHTDFIFALIGEELGLLGCVAVLICFGVLAMRGFRVATRSRDCFSSLLAFGITFLFVGQALLNIAVALGMLPTKGMPLPLVSYGGSAMMAAGVQVGILLALSREART